MKRKIKDRMGDLHGKKSGKCVGNENEGLK